MSKILIIEDNELARENISEILELEGFETLVAHHGKQGLQLAQQYWPDLIVCDVMMPTLDGYGVLEQLGQKTSLASIPFIFLTAKSSHQDFRQGMNLGSNDYLTKPFSPADLVTAVRSQLRKRQLVARTYTREIDQLRLAVSQLTEQDAVTQLPNQKSLMQILEKPQRPGNPLALVVIALDQLSLLSGALLTSDSDRLMQAIAQRIEKIFPRPHGKQAFKETFRLGDNQFAVLTSQLSTEMKSPDDLIRSVHRLLNAPYRVAGQIVKLTFSIGIAATDGIPKPASLSTVTSLLRDATAAVNQAQQAGGNGYCFYEKKIALDTAERLRIANALHYAIEGREFQIHYQPQVSVVTGEVMGVEALVRWQNPQLGWVSPGKFIPVAEEIGVIDKLDRWVLSSACQQAKAWQQSMAKAISVSVNLSALQLGDIHLCDTIRMVLRQTGLPAHLLHLEITETALVKQKRLAIEILQHIRNLGVRIAIDDFGTGYAGLEYLSKLPCHTLKIDRSFIQNIPFHSTNQRIVAAVIAMGRDLNLSVIAEGAETAAELAYLKQQNCDLVQGYIYAKPMPAVEVEPFVKALAAKAPNPGPG